MNKHLIGQPPGEIELRGNNSLALLHLKQAHSAMCVVLRAHLRRHHMPAAAAFLLQVFWSIHMQSGRCSWMYSANNFIRCFIGILHNDNVYC